MLGELPEVLSDGHGLLLGRQGVADAQPGGGGRERRHKGYTRSNTCWLQIKSEFINNMYSRQMYSIQRNAPFARSAQ